MNLGALIIINIFTSLLFTFHISLDIINKLNTLNHVTLDDHFFQLNLKMFWKIYEKKLTNLYFLI
jgi:hypothetical protein